MKRRLGMAFILFVLLILQTTVFYEVFATLGRLPVLSFLRGHTLDLVLILLAYLSLHRSVWTALIWASIISLCCDGMGHAWRGSQTLSYLSLALILSVGRQFLMLRTPMSRALFFIGLTVLDGTFQYYWGAFFERQKFFWGSYWGDLLVQGMLNASVATLLVTVWIEFDYWAKGYRFAEQNVVFSDGRRYGIKVI